MERSESEALGHARSPLTRHLPPSARSHHQGEEAGYGHWDPMSPNCGNFYDHDQNHVHHNGKKKLLMKVKEKAKKWRHMLAKKKHGHSENLTHPWGVRLDEGEEEDAEYHGAQMHESGHAYDTYKHVSPACQVNIRKHEKPDNFSHVHTRAKESEMKQDNDIHVRLRETKVISPTNNSDQGIKKKVVHQKLFAAGNEKLADIIDSQMNTSAKESDMKQANGIHVKLHETKVISPTNNCDREIKNKVVHPKMFVDNFNVGTGKSDTNSQMTYAPGKESEIKKSNMYDLKLRETKVISLTNGGYPGIKDKVMNQKVILDNFNVGNGKSDINSQMNYATYEESEMKEENDLYDLKLQGTKVISPTNDCGRGIKSNATDRKVLFDNFYVDNGKSDIISQMNYAPDKEDSEMKQAVDMYDLKLRDTKVISPTEDCDWGIKDKVTHQKVSFDNFNVGNEKPDINSQMNYAPDKESEMKQANHMYDIKPQELKVLSPTSNCDRGIENNVTHQKVFVNHFNVGNGKSDIYSQMNYASGKESEMKQEKDMTDLKLQEKKVIFRDNGCYPGIKNKGTNQKISVDNFNPGNGKSDTNSQMNYAPDKESELKQANDLYDHKPQKTKETPPSKDKVMHQPIVVDCDNCGNKKLTEMVAELIAPAYIMVSEATNTIALKLRESRPELAKQAWNKGVSMKEYLMNKLEPGEDDRALSLVITEALRPRTAKPRHIKPEPRAVSKPKEAVSSLLRREESLDSPIPISTNPHPEVVAASTGRASMLISSN